MKSFPLLLILFFCTTNMTSQSEAQLLVEKSIKFHDPKNNWNKLKVDLTINSIVERKGEIDSSERQIYFDLKKNIFDMTVMEDGAETKLYLDNDRCYGEVVGNELSAEELTEKNLTCDRAKMFNSYFRYLIGLPMKLNDPGTIIHETVTQKSYKNVEYDVVTVTYDPAVGSYTWLFYFDKQNNELVLTEFSKDGTFMNGETIELNNKVKYQKMLLPGQLMWYVLPDRPFLAEENISFSKPK